MELDASWDIPDPTSLNARRQLNGLLELLPQNSSLTAEFHTVLSQNALLPTLSRFMLQPSLTLAISWAFRPLLMDLCARWLDTDGEDYEKLEALSLLIEVHEEIFPIISSFLRRFEKGPLSAFMNGKEVEHIDNVPLHRVLLAYYRILRATPALPKSLNWDLTFLLKLCTTQLLDRGARWLAIRCYSLQSNMSESVRINMERDALGEICDEDCPIKYGEDISGTVKEVDGWMLPVLEMSRIQDYRNSILESPDYFVGSEKSDIVIENSDLSPRIANVHGILLLRSPPSKPISSSLVLTSPALLSLRQLAVNISLRRPTLLTSTPSSGKTSFLDHLAVFLHPSSPNQVITIHLADTSLDPRSLLGSYVSSATSAGSFEWKDGVLVKAMREGRWVVLKDIDRASSEVLGLITPLAESMDDIRPIGSNAILSLGNRGTVEAAESFALFATRSVEGSNASSIPPLSFLGAQKWREIAVPENSLDDLRLIVDSKFPKIAGPVSDKLIDIWLTVKRLRVLTSTRPVGIRDLEKFCSRVSRLLESNRAITTHQRQLGEMSPSIIALLPHPTLREEIYLDARDVFFAAGASNIPALEQRNAIAMAIGEKLSLSEETCEWLLKRRTAFFEIEKDIDGRPIAIRAGRTTLGVDPANSLSDSTSARPFSMHRQARRLISQLAASVSAIEPVLLTGETGTGKTSVVSHLASSLNRPLISLNLSNQTESSDLIGGFRPVSARVPALELQQRFTELFQKTFSNKKNEQLLQSLRKAVANEKWKVAVKLWTETTRTAISKLKKKRLEDDVLRPDETLDAMDSPSPRKRRKMQSEKSRSSEAEWTAFNGDVHHFEVQHVLDKGKFSFHYVEGPLVKAIRTGAWVLLDEINLASPETLECIAGLLQGPSASITLTEQGSLEPVPRHPGFRLFACMNPATDVGKKDLPSNIRARFTEIEVPPPDEDQEALVDVIKHYIGHLAVTDKAVISDIAELYTSVKRLAASGKIADGSDHRPHYSMRSLSRALTFAADTIQSFGLRRALWEGFTMTFTMVLDQASADAVLDLARRTLLSNVKNKAHFLSIHPPSPQHGLADSYVQLGPFWLSSGPCDREEVSDYILTPSVQKKLIDLARIIMIKRHPILIEGPTSSGKTSAIQYLARRTGHNFVRINNHEHTDIQEYLGSYVSDSKTGKLIFRDGLLVRALRRGDWIVLDELNLAPTDVLEALNRLLDDNRELVVPETQEIVRPHPHFMLFATQNPSGVYAGRKVLSRALRNRFLEVHFDDVPPTELEHILCQRSRIAPSYSQRIVSVFHELQKRRQLGRIFEGKEGFATLRDLFRWAGRDAQGYQELAENGYMLLAERTRHVEDKTVVKEVIEKVMNVTISENSLYSTEKLGHALESQSGIVWTKPMQRLFILLSRALRHNEPVLLVGETGSGKTSVCQVYAEIENQVLRTVNCHQNTEAADIIGGLRPIRQEASLEQGIIREAAEILGIGANVNLMDKAQIMELITSQLRAELSPHERNTLIAAQRTLLPNRGLLGWQDGPLVTSMRSADVFLLDEISLADDSVLERLNSILEPSRTLVLAERGGETADEFQIVAEAGFKFVATMNPGGDFGKKELSPALRNRFTEIWVPSLMNRVDLAEIVKQSWTHDGLVQLTDSILDFVDWIMCEAKDTSLLTLRDILSWVNFCNIMSRSTNLPPAVLFVHGGEMTILDGLSSLTQLSSWSAESLRALNQRARHRLIELSPGYGTFDQESSLDVSVESGKFRIGPFYISIGSQPTQLSSFSFKAPTSLKNAFRLLRACQITKPVLLEGSPGVGKTSLVTALAAAAGQKLCRINLSEQTDLVDLFGSDLPVEGHASGSFGWSDAEFLRALKYGHWVLLDEMNLASQSVLEGLNAVFDHRGTVYVPELDRSFSRHPDFRVFAAQNPLNQGSGRKGLPKSFLNRFTKVFIEQLSASDLLLICQYLFPVIEPSILQLMITFNCRLQEEVVVERRFGISGSPWEFNLRDIMRWASLVVRPDGIVEEPWKHLNTVYGTRFRTESDKVALLKLFANVFDDTEIARKMQSRFILTPEYVVCGNSLLWKGFTSGPDHGPRLLPSQLNKVESALSSMTQNWLVIVTGPHSSGKTSFVRALASASAQPLQEISLGSSSDTSDLIGSFEQTTAGFHAQHLLESLLRLIDVCTTQARLDSAESLDVLLRLKGNAITARQTHSLNSLQELVRASLKVPFYNPSIRDLRTSLEAALDLSAKVENSGPMFEWIDGPLVRAMRQGQWLLLDNANLCSPSVLDRLNSLCELNGSIVLTERGADQEIVYPHPNFRLVMTMDPYRGEISRAMRNRGIEIALEPLIMQGDAGSLRDAKRLTLRDMSFSSRPSFELSRRAISFANRSRSDGKTVSAVGDRNYVDSLSSRMMEIKALYKHCDYSYDNAITLFLFGYSSPFCSKGLIRVLKSFGTSRATSLSEQLSLFLASSNGLRFLFANIARSRQLDDEQNMPLHPYLFSPHVDWLSGDDRKTCLTVSLILESCMLASGMELQLRRQATISVEHVGGPMQTSVSREHVDVTRFVGTIPMLVRKAFLERVISNDTLSSDAQVVLELIHYARHLYQAANQPIADFSTLHAVSGWILHHAKAASHIIQELEEQAKALHDTYALCSGQKIGEIWSSLYQPVMPSRAIDLLDQLKTLPLDIQIRVIDLVSLICAARAITVEMSKDLQQVEHDLTKNLSGISSNRENLMWSTRPGNNLAMLTIEMGDLACLSPFVDKSNMKKTIRLLKQSVTLAHHAHRVVAYQLLLWKVDAKIAMISELVTAHLEWHRAVWDCDELTQTSGPSALYTPVLLRSAIAASSNIDSGALHNIRPRRALLSDQISQSLSECCQFQSRESLTIAFLLRNIELTLHVCFPDLDEDAFRETELASDYQSAIVHLVGVLQHPLYEPFDSLRFALNAVAGSASWADRVLAMGKCWIVLSQILLSLYVPNIHIDPLRVQNCKRSFRNAQESWLRSQIHVHSSWEWCRTGKRNNVFTRLLQDRLQHMENDSHVENLEYDIDRQRDFFLLQSFWNETQNFLSEIMSPRRLERYILATAEASEDVLPQESLLQNSITNFVQRMKNVYAPLQDLTPAIELAMMQVRFGLRTLRHSSVLSSRPSLSPNVHMILSFPSVQAKNAVSIVRSEELVQPGFSSGDALLLQLIGLSQSISRENRMNHGLVEIRSLYERISSLWNTKLTNEAERAHQAESLYRSQQVVHDAVDDDPDDEQVLQLFPTFADDDGETDSTTVSKEHIRPENSLTLSSGFGQKLLNVHLLLFGSTASRPQREYGALWDSLRSQMVSCWVNGPLLSLACNVDDDSLAFRLELLRNAKSRFQRTDEGNAFSFYRDPDLQEARKAADLVNELRDKLCKLIHLWPDQLVLQHLRDRCDSVLSMNMSSPVAKMLGAIERLLLHTEDWEMFANRENSLNTHRQSLTELIVEWRKLELAGWRSILEYETEAFCIELGDWWFRLYDATVRGPIAASQEPVSVDSLNHYFDSLTPLIEDFITSSPLGQFQRRLHMIWSFALMTSGFAAIEETSKETMKRASQILFSVHLFYDQFVDKVSTLFADRRALIEKDIQSLVKLATWRDVNVHALQQSAQKTHKQLYRRIRKFRELLRQPIASQLQIGDRHADAPTTPGEADQTVVLGRNSETSETPRALKRFVSVLSNNLSHILDSSSALAIEELSSTIISVQEGYTKSAPEKNLSPDERKRWNSALLVRKRRSWNDFLKELKRIGISPNVKPEILQKHRSKRCVMEQSTLNLFAGASFVSRLKKVDSYFYRSIGLLNDLLQCDGDHHPDIATRELQRGVSSFESAFSYATSARARISDLTRAWDCIRAFSRRLHALEQSHGTCIAASSIGSLLQEVEVKMTETLDALDELLNVAANISNLSEDGSSHKMTALDGLRGWISSSADILNRLSELSRGLENSNFLTEDDLDLICLSIKHLESTESLLSDLAVREPGLRRFCDAIRDWSHRRLIETSLLNVAASVSALQADSNNVVDLLLVIGQDLLEAERLMTGDEVDDSGHVRRQHAMQLQVSRVLRMDKLLLHLQNFAQNLYGKSRQVISDSLRQILPFLDNYIAFVERYLLEYLAWTKSLLKLTYISGCLLRNIAQNGFCKPLEVEDADGAEGAVESAEGTGLGQGEGKEDVSNQIEDESQFEGVRGQEDETNGRQKEDGGDAALDVDFDLGGELEDGPEQESSPEDAEEEEEEDMPDLDDEFDQDTSDDLKPVDENFWNEQSEDKSVDGQDMDESNAEGGEPEMAAKEKEHQANETKTKEDPEQNKSLPNEEEDAMEKVEPDFEDKEQVSAQKQEPDAKMDDDVDLSQPEDAPTQPEGPEEMINDLDELNIDEELTDVEKQSQYDHSELEDDDEGEIDPKEVGTELTKDETGDQGEGEAISSADTYADNGADDGGNMEADDASGPRENEPQVSEEASAELPPSTGRETKQSTSNGNSKVEAADHIETAPAAQSDPNAVSRGAELGQNPSNPLDAPLPNPHRSLGDAVREVKRRFDEIKDAADAESTTPAAQNDAAKSTALEYVPDDSMDVDMQALGPAMGEESAKLNKLNLLEEHDEMQAAAPSEIPSAHSDDTQDHAEASRLNQTKDEGREPARRADQQGENANLQAMDVDNDLQGVGELPELSTDEQELIQGKNVEIELNKWRREGQLEENGRHIWQLYDALTQSLSFSLCEQLRLILEPTRATRLMGDFRTGKRLNMKKIIPYIASNYTKDKIWLRRVRPSQREYQVLIALDDSRSMAESHSIHLAFQTLALVSKALNRLEVGDVAIASFGERMQMLHGFEDGPFTDQEGTKVVEAFKFAQTATDVRSLLESSVEALAKARERRVSSSPSDLWQLEIIISDGICQDHEELRAIMRKAEEEHILIVFIVIDAHHESSLDDSAGDASRSQNSIINMNQAMYRTVNGRLELHMQRYLDSFPFEFFVVLKSVEALPDVLADTLRQFFERISAS